VLNRSGTNGNPITVKNYTGESPIVDGTGLCTGITQYLVDVPGSYNVLDGFEIRNWTFGGLNWDGNLRLTNVWGSYNIIRNCNIHDGWGAGILIMGTGNTLEDSSVHDSVKFSISYPSNTSWPGGITVGAYDSSSYGIPQNCTIRRVRSYRNGGEGIMSENSSYTTIEDCEIYDNFAVNIHCTDSDHAIVQRNLIYATSDGDTLWGMASRGICLTVEWTAPTANANGGLNNTIVNNIVYNTGEPFSVWSYYSTHCQNNVVANNTFVDGRVSGKGAGPQMTRWGWAGGGTVSGNVFRNNIIDSTVNGVSSLSGTPGAGWTFDHNIWRLTPSGITVDGTSTVANPNLTRSGTYLTDFFRPQVGSWAYSHGTPVSGVTVDKFSVARNGSTPTVGAIETSSASDYTTTGAPWTRTDVGSVPTASTDEYSPSLVSYRQVGYGADMWGTADAFGFTYRQITGDFVFSYKVVSTVGGGAYSKAGCDVRVALTAGSRHVSINQIPGSTIQRLRRSADNGVTSASNAYTSSAYHRVVRTGDLLTTAYSADGSTWTTLTTEDITGWGTALYVGRVVCANDASASMTAVFSEVVLSYTVDAVGTMSVGFALLGQAAPFILRDVSGSIDVGFALLGASATAAIIETYGTIATGFALAGVADPNVATPETQVSVVFGNYKRARIGTAQQIAYGPVGAGMTSSIVGCQISNITASAVRVTMGISDGGTTFYRAYRLRLPAKSAFYPFAAGLHIELNEGDRLVVWSDTENSLDSVVSYVERA
jgi:hypothetical protein